MRWATGIAVLVAAGCVYDPQCVDGYEYGPDDRCIPETTGPNDAGTDGFRPGIDMRMPGVDMGTADLGMECDPERYLMGRSGQCTLGDEANLTDSDALASAGACFDDCAGRGEDCIAECVTTDLSLTVDCGECVAATTLCGLDQCAAFCADPTSPDCARCICETSDCPACVTVFARCAGFPAPFCGGMASMCTQPTPFPPAPPSGAPPRCTDLTRQCVRTCLDQECVDRCLENDTRPPTPSGDTCADCVYQVSLGCLSRHPTCEAFADDYLCCVESMGCERDNGMTCCVSEYEALVDCNFTSAATACTIDNSNFDVCF